MRRAGQFVILFCLAAGLSFAQGEGGGADNLQLWKWANFLLLAGGLGYLMAKTLPKLFAERSRSITSDITESDRIRRDAEARAADVERRLASLEAEIASLRAEAQKESQAETARLAARAAADLAKIREQSERDIADAVKAARTELKRYAAALAIDLAEGKIRARMTPAIEAGLVRGFVRDLR
jgi:F-type H+-transporting ATPase subunit b